MAQTLDAIEMAALLSGKVLPQTHSTACYTCGEPLRDDGVCTGCAARLGRLEIKRAVKTLFAPGDLVEVRAFRKTGPAVSGLFDDRRSLAHAVYQLELSRDYRAVYWTLNPVARTFGAGAERNVIHAAGRTVGNTDIAARRWLFVDLDPVRESDTSATDAEIESTREVRERVLEFLAAQGWPEPVTAFSGNGQHLLYRLADLPNTDQTNAAVSGALRALSARFSTPVVQLDTAVGNAGRICKAYGTTSRKGEDTATRPWRGSHVLNAPSSPIALTLAQLQSLAGIDPTAPRATRGESGMASGFDIDAFAAHYELDILNPGGELKNGLLYHYLRECPFKGAPHSGDARKMALTLGSVLGFKCFSDDCAGHGIGDLLRHLNHTFEPYLGPLFAERDRHPLYVDSNGEDCYWELPRAAATSAPERVPNTDPEIDSESQHAPAQTEALTPADPKLEVTVMTAPPTPHEELYGFEDHAPKAAKVYAPQPDRCPIPLPDDAMYGWLKEKAKTLQSPMGWAYPALMTAFAGQGVNMGGGREERATLFTCLLGGPGDGKSRTMDRALDTLLSLDKGQVITSTPGSERGLIKLLAPPKPVKGEPSEEPKLKSFLLAMDEFLIVMNKIAIQGSSLAPLLCTAYYKNSFGGADKSGEDTALAYLSVLGCLKCTDEADFEKIFGKDTNDGLYIRFMFGLGQKSWRWNNHWKPQPEYRVPVTTTLDPDSAAGRLHDAWTNLETTDSDGNTQLVHLGRVAEQALRVARVTSSANHERVISEACMRAALKFAEWQEKVRVVYQTGVAENKDAEATAAMLRRFEKERDKWGRPVWFRWASLFRSTSWNKTYGPVVITRLRQGLVQMGTLTEWEVPDDDTTGGAKRKKPASGIFRLTGPMTNADEEVDPFMSLRRKGK